MSYRNPHSKDEQNLRQWMYKFLLGITIASAVSILLIECL